MHRSTPHGLVTFRASPSPTWRAAVTGSRGIPSVRATTLPDPILSAASLTLSGPGGAAGNACSTPSTTALSVPPPPAATTSEGRAAAATWCAAADRALGWSSTTAVCTSRDAPYPERSAIPSCFASSAGCPVPEARLRIKSADGLTARSRRFLLPRQDRARAGGE